MLNSLGDVSLTRRANLEVPAVRVSFYGDAISYQGDMTDLAY